MTTGATLRLVRTALMRNRMRSLLTALGIVIGVAAVVIMQSLGEGATQYIQDQISGLGSNVLFATPGSTRMMGPQAAGVPLFTSGDLESIQRRAHNIDHIGPRGSRGMSAVYGANNHNTIVSGTTPDFFQIRRIGVLAGRELTDEDERTGALVCVIGQTVRDALFFGEDAIGKEIRIHNIPMRVVGVLESLGSAMGMDADDIIYIPFATFSRRVIGRDRIAAIFFSAVSQDRMDDAKEEVTLILRQRRHILPGEQDDFVVRDPREMAALLETVTGTLTILLSSIAAISLLVGGIGIMNIMLVSVTERTREIGIRLAVGARAGDILTQFLVEATILSGIGGMLGLFVGMAVSYFATGALGVPFVVPFSVIPLAFGVSVFIGIVFGVVPARKASRLNPLDALRYE